MQASRPDEIGAKIALRTYLLLYAEVVLVVVRRLQRPAGKGIETDRQGTGGRTRLNPRAGRGSRTKDRLEGAVCIGSGIDCTAGHAGGYGDSSNLTARAADKGRIVGCVHRRQIGNLHWDDVIEDSKAAVNRRRREQLAGKRSARLVDKQRRCGKEIVGVAEDRLIHRSITVMTCIEEGAGRAREEILCTGDIGIPGEPHAEGECRFRRGLVCVHGVELEVAG